MRHSKNIPGNVARMLYTHGYQLIDREGKCWHGMGKKKAMPPDKVAPYQLRDESVDGESSERAASIWRDCVLLREDGEMYVRRSPRNKRWERRFGQLGKWEQVDPGTLFIIYRWVILDEPVGVPDQAPKPKPPRPPKAPTKTPMAPSTAKKMRELRTELNKLRARCLDLQKQNGEL